LNSGSKYPDNWCKKCCFHCIYHDFSETYTCFAKKGQCTQFCKDGRDCGGTHCFKQKLLDDQE